MDFELTELQSDLAEGMRRLCEGRFALDALRTFESADQVVDRTGWRQLGEAGVFNLCLPESPAGWASGWPRPSLVFEELGRALVPGPLVASHLAAGLVDGADDGSVVVGLVEARPCRRHAPCIPVVIEYLDDLDVLLVLSDAGVDLRRPRRPRRRPPAAAHGPADPGVDA